MEIRLKQVISQSAQRNTLSSIDWEQLPLPQQMIQTDRLNSLGPAGTVAPWSESFSVLNVRETDSPSHPSSKKRKSSDQIHADHQGNSTPPWRSTNSHPSFEDRLSFADKRPRMETSGKASKSLLNMETRKRRFDDGPNGRSSPMPLSSPRPVSPAPDVVRGPIVGTCPDLEKQYFRLTSAPKPETVRPLPVLEQTLEMLKQKWKKENNYSYICDQFKSLRQDLTVQHIMNDFTVDVYEIHARIALERSDLGEYNQCQTRLRALYRRNLGGHPTEFKAYRILYFIHTCNRTEMNDVLADLTGVEKESGAVRHALEARSALALGNYHRFFQLYLETPNMGAYLMDMFIARERLAALTNICKA